MGKNKFYDKIEHTYCCGFCGNEFQATLKTFKGDAGAKGSYANQIQCKNCGNFLPNGDYLL